MKKLVSILAVALALVSCSQQPQYVAVQQPPMAAQQPVQTGTDAYGNPTYEVVQNGAQQAVIVNNTDGTQFFMDYVLFNSLLNNGGWGSVYNRYSMNPGLYYNAGLYNTYSSWHHYGYYNYAGGHTVVVNHYSGSPFSTYSHTHVYSSTRVYHVPATVRTTYTRTTPVVSRQTVAPARTYTPTARVAPTRTYTPTRSYSPPSRSSYSPSRSGRH